MGKPGSSAVTSLPSITLVQAGATKEPRKNSFLAFWLMLMNPPEPGSLDPNLLTLTFPCRSACAMPRKAASRPPPS